MTSVVFPSMSATSSPGEIPEDALKIAGQADAGDITGARQAVSGLLQSRPDDYFLLHLSGSIALAESRNEAAIEEFHRAVQHAPDRPNEAMSWNGTGQALLALRHYERAAEAFRLAIRMDPGCVAHSLDFARALDGSNKLQLAEEVLRDCMRRLPGDPAPATALAGIWTQHGRQQDALALLDAARRCDPYYAPAYFNASAALAMLGRVEAAYTACRAAMRLDPTLAHYYQLANLGPVDEDQINMLRQRVSEGSTASVEVRVDAGFALAIVYSRRGEYDLAFEQLERANRLKRATLGFNIAHSTKRVRALQAFFTASLFARFENKLHCDLKPIFIIGMPRSGSTLIEQMLAAHPDVQAGGELLYLPNICRVVGETWVARRLTSPVSDAEVAADLKSACEEYGRLTEPLWRGHARFTDKLLGNYHMLGMIQLMFPQATIIHARRDPFDTCLSCYERLFSSAMDFVYDLHDLGVQYRLYEELMAHWHAVLPASRILDVDYEMVVAQPEGQVRRVLEHCGLPFDAACLSFYSVRRPVTTASMYQVTRPIYRTSIGRWRHYRKHLQPLAEALGRTLPD